MYIQDIYIAHHEGETDGDFLDGFDDPEQHQTEHLYGCEQMDPACRDVPQVHVVWLVLSRHQQDTDSVYELHA